MHESIHLFLFTLLYYQLDAVLKPLVYDRYEIFQQEPILFYPVIQSANIFILSLFSLFTVYLIMFSKNKNYATYSLSMIYIKYVTDNILHYNTISIYQYEFQRSIMWLFTTPLILKLYCDMNAITMLDVCAHYHILSNTVHIFTFPLHRTNYHSYIVISLTCVEGAFIYKLFDFKEQKYTNFIIYIWSLFSFIEVLGVANVFGANDIQMCYLLGDMIAKLTMILIVNDHEEQLYYIRNSVDLQSISLLSSMTKAIKQFESTTNLTPKCRSLIQRLEQKFMGFIPADKTFLKLELLKKILPMELEDRYLTQTKEYKPYNFICVLFTDIVSYTDLAKTYDDDVIYKLLNDIYTRFDDIVIRYRNLQKIETIGDAYMVVGDIYTNDTKNNVRNMILLAIYFLKEIKRVSSPNNQPLQLRIGINLGKVVVGILGVEIPRLCVVGNTVNVANRLQTTADPDTIQISKHIYEIAAQTDFGMPVEFELKENVFLKNIGTTYTYVIRPPPLMPDATS